jgi:hypothetical protein
MALRIGEILVQRGLISREQLDRGLTTQRRWGVRVGVCLVRLGFIDEQTLAVSLHEQLGIPLAGASALDAVPAPVIARVPPQVALKHRLIPIRVEGNEVHVCLADPQNLLRLDDIAFILGSPIRPYLATELQIDRALARYYPGPTPWEAMVDPDSGELDLDKALDAAHQWRGDRPASPAINPAPSPPPAPEPATAESATPPTEKAAPTENATPTSPEKPPEPPEKPPEQSAAAPDNQVPPPEKDAAAPDPPADAAAARKQQALLALSRGLGAVRKERPTPGPEPARPAPAPEPPPESKADKPPPPGPSPYVALAAVTSRQDLALALRAHLGPLFPTLCLLELDGQNARFVGFRAPSGAEGDGSGLAPIPIDRERWTAEVNARAPFRVLDQIRDPLLAAALERLGIPSAGMAVAPVMDGAAPAYLLLGRGPGETELKGLTGKLRPYLQAASDALRLIALRDQILGREHAETVDRPVSDQASTRHLDFSGACADPRLRPSR